MRLFGLFVVAVCCVLANKILGFDGPASMFGVAVATASYVIMTEPSK